MRKIALCSFALVVTLFAESDIKKFEVAPYIGFNMFDSDSAMEDDSLFGIRGTYNLDKYYGLRIGYEGAYDAKYDTAKYQRELGGTSSKNSINLTDIHRFSGEVVVRGDEDYNVIPYVFLGLGYEYLSDETSHDVSQGLLDAGLGFKYQAWKNLNLILEGKTVRKFDTHDFDNIISLGVGYIFGQSIINPNRIVKKSIADTKEIKPAKTMFETKLDNSVQYNSVETIDTVIEDILREEPNNNVVYNTEVESESFKNNAVVQVDIIDRGVIDDIDLVESSEQTTLDDILGEAPAPVTVKRSVVSVDGTKQYYVKLATLFSNGSAKSIITNIQNKNYQAQEIGKVINGKNVRFVVAGPFIDRAEAKIALADLKSIKKDAYITKL